MTSDLNDLEVDEVSLVKRPANKKRFFLSKKAEQMKSLTAAILAMPSDEKSDSLIDVEKNEISKETAQVLGDVKKLLEAVKEELSPELMDRLAESLGLRSERRREEEEEEKMDEEDEEEKLKADDIFKSDDPAVMALFKKHQELESLYKAELFEKKRSSYIAKAEKDLAAVPGMKADEIGILLSDIDDLSPKHADRVVALLKSVESFARQSKAFEEIGTSSIETGDSAEKRLDAMARARVAKNGESYAGAYTKVLDENPSLYSQYIKEGVN